MDKRKKPIELQKKIIELLKEGSLTKRELYRKIYGKSRKGYSSLQYALDNLISKGVIATEQIEGKEKYVLYEVKKYASKKELNILTKLLTDKTVHRQALKELDIISRTKVIADAKFIEKLVELVKTPVDKECLKILLATINEMIKNASENKILSGVLRTIIRKAQHDLEKIVIEPKENIELRIVCVRLLGSLTEYNSIKTLKNVIKNSSKEDFEQLESDLVLAFIKLSKIYGIEARKHLFELLSEKNKTIQERTQKILDRSGSFIGID